MTKVYILINKKDNYIHSVYSSKKRLKMLLEIMPLLERYEVQEHSVIIGLDDDHIQNRISKSASDYL